MRSAAEQLQLDILAARADAFQTRAHVEFPKKPQNAFRKYTHEPYYMHPRRVALIASKFDISPNAVAAALLHDVLEDTTLTTTDLLGQFDQEVVDMVLEVTDISKLSDGNRAVRKEIDRRHLANARPEMQTVKIADLLHNGFTIVRYDEKFKPLFLAEKKLLLDVLGFAHPGIRVIAQAFVDENL